MATVGVKGLNATRDIQTASFLAVSHSSVQIKASLYVCVWMFAVEPWKQWIFYT